MLSPEDWKVISKQQVIYDIAKGLDPLAFENDDSIDREKRLTAVYGRIMIAYKEYQRRDMCEKYDPFEILEGEYIY